MHETLLFSDYDYKSYFLLIYDFFRFFGKSSFLNLSIENHIPEVKQIISIIFIHR